MKTGFTQRLETYVKTADKIPYVLIFITGGKIVMTRRLSR